MNTNAYETQGERRLWQTPLTCAIATRLRPGVTLTTFRGQADDNLAPWLGETLDWLFEASAPNSMNHFVDLRGVIGASSKIRNVYVSKLLEHRNKFASLHCHYDHSHAINALIVKTVNLVLGGFATIHQSPEAFERALAEVSFARCA